MQKSIRRKYYDGPPTSSHTGISCGRFTREASYLKSLENGKPRRKLLDVAVRTAISRAFMARGGWEVEGVEVSGRPANHDFPVYTQISKHPANEPTYDAVTAWAVLEHVHDPMAYFRKPRSGEKDGLFVFLVPISLAWPPARSFARTSRQPLFFHAETVQQYLEKTGFVLDQEDNGRGIYKLAPHNWLRVHDSNAAAGQTLPI